MHHVDEAGERDARRKRSWAIGGALLALGAGVAGGIALGCAETPGQVRRLPDGTRLELRGWTYTPGERFVDGSFWQRVAPRLALPFLQLGGYQGTTSHGGDLALWFRASDDPPVHEAFSGIWIDEHGCRIAASERIQGRWTLTPVRMPAPPGATPPPGLFVAPTGDVRWAATPDTRPRRGTGPLTFALVREEPPALLATYTVPRPPESGSFPAWQGAPLPAAAQGDPTVLLTSLRPHEGDRPCEESVATFRFLGSGPHATSWEPAMVTVSDATGNRLVQALWQTRAATFRSLCRSEPAWRIRVRFARPNPSGVPADLEWTWRDVPLTPARRDGALLPALARGEVQARLEMLKKLPGRSWDPRPQAFAQVAVTCPEGYQLTLKRATDQHDRPVGVPQVYFGRTTQDRTRNPGSGESCPFYLPVRPGTRRLNLTFALHRTRTAEFLVRP